MPTRKKAAGRKKQRVTGDSDEDQECVPVPSGKLKEVQLWYAIPELSVPHSPESCQFELRVSEDHAHHFIAVKAQTSLRLRPISIEGTGVMFTFEVVVGESSTTNQLLTMK